MAEKTNPINITAQEGRSADQLRPETCESLALEPNHHRSGQEAVKENCISRIPVEILISIFKTAIDGHDSLVIGALLLVCRFWNEIIIYTPTLWSRIVLCPQDNHCDFTKLAKYVDTAIQKSHNLPLDLYIDFGRVPEKPVMFGPMNPEGKYRYGETTLQDNSLELALLSHTIGDSGAVMKRWKSFFFRHNDTMWYIQDFLKSFIHPTPFLQQLSLHVNRVFYHRPIISPFPEVPALQTVALSAAGGLDEIVCPPQTLEMLSISLWKNISTLKPSFNLRILAVDCFVRGGDGFREDGEAISFPRLECLTLRSERGNRPFVQLVQRIEALSLKRLRLLGAPAVFIGLRAASFYKVKDLHLLMEEDASHYLCAKFEMLLQHEGTSANEIMSSSSLQAHISNYSALNNVIVTPWHLDPAIQALRALKAESKAPVALHAVTTLVGDRKGAHLVEGKQFKDIVEAWKPAEDFVYKSHSVIS